MSDIFEAFGVLDFPSVAKIAAWKRSLIDDESCAVVAAFAGERQSDGSEKVSDAFAMHAGSTSDFIAVLDRGAKIEISMMFDENLLSDYGATLFGALAQAANQGATGTLYIVEGGDVIHSLVLKDGTANLVKQKKRLRTTTLPEAAAHQKRIVEWAATR